jgi:hypothetical protein
MTDHGNTSLVMAWTKSRLRDDMETPGPQSLLVLTTTAALTQTMGVRSAAWRLIGTTCNYIEMAQVRLRDESSNAMLKYGLQGHNNNNGSRAQAASDK